jgi:head-tail adaptor
VSGILSLLNTTVTVKRPVADYDDMGGVKYTLSTISSDTLARISPANATEIKNGPIEYAEATTMIYTAANVSVQRGDTIEHGSRTYEVLGVRTPSVPNHHLASICKEKQIGA